MNRPPAGEGTGVEAVAWRIEVIETGKRFVTLDEGQARHCEAQPSIWRVKPLYAHPVPSPSSQPNRLAELEAENGRLQREVDLHKAHAEAAETHVSYLNERFQQIIRQAGCFTEALSPTERSKEEGRE